MIICNLAVLAESRIDALHAFRYPREEACEKLKTNTGMIASFSRALMEGITQGMSDEEFEGSLDKAIQSIFDAST